MEDKNQSCFRQSFAVSAALHLLFAFAVLMLIWRGPKTTHVSPPHWIELEYTRETPRDLVKNQVVQTERGDAAKTPPPEAYLGERNQSVDRQTVSAKHTTMIGNPEKTAENTGQAEKKSSPASRQQPAAGETLPLSRLGAQLFAPKPGKPKTDEQIAHEENWADQAGSPQDYVRGLKESNRTALNTKEFIFYSYYQRIRERLDRAWVPILREKLLKYYDSGRHIASEMDQSTEVLVILNAQGEVTTVKVVSESGTQPLDDSAVNAFNAAGPFPNPPHGMIGTDGQIQIPWEFILRS